MELYRYRKFIAALLGAASLAVSQGLIAGTAARWVAIIIATATSLGVYRVSNQPVAPDAFVDRPRGRHERGAIDPGSLALGILIVLLLIWLFADRPWR